MLLLQPVNCHFIFIVDTCTCSTYYILLLIFCIILDIKHKYAEALFVDIPTCCDNNNGNQINTLTIVEVVLF